MTEPSRVPPPGALEEVVRRGRRRRLALAMGARLFRVHDVRASREALDVAWAIAGAGAGAAAPAS